MSIIYPSVEDILMLHEFLIEEIGGSSGVRDRGLVESAVFRPRQFFGGDDLYPGLFQKAAALFESLVKNHPFVDGNKRTAALSAVTFMQRNGMRVTASNEELVTFTLSVATNSPGIDVIAAWFEAHSAAIE